MTLVFLDLGSAEVYNQNNPFNRNTLSVPFVVGQVGTDMPVPCPIFPLVGTPIVVL